MQGFVLFSHYVVTPEMSAFLFLVQGIFHECCQEAVQTQHILCLQQMGRVGIYSEAREK